MAQSVLVVDDEPGIRRAVAAELEDQGFEVVQATTGSEALLRFREQPTDLVVTDLKMDPVDGLQVLQEVKRSRPETEVLLMTAHGSMDTARAAMRSGAYDHLPKPFDMDDLVLAITKMAEKFDLRSENIRLRADLKQRYSFENVIGQSGAMQEVFSLVQRVAARTATVLLRGESGTGKEIVARLIHHQSERADAPFLAINCAALPETLLESELFGHEKGAFTGASSRRDGLFREAEGGTLLLDEIGEIPTNIQVKLLRVLQEREVRPLGGRGTIAVDVRVLAATNRDLEAGISEGWFREDLYYRLSVFPIFVPPLRERQSDIEPLATHFLAKRGFADYSLGANTIEKLRGYYWPGNVRELENIIERAALMTDDGAITPAQLPAHITAGAVPGTPRGGQEGFFTLPEDGIHLEKLEEELIRQAIRMAEGNKTKAAKLLGITRRTLYSRLEKMGWKTGDEP